MLIDINGDDNNGCNDYDNGNGDDGVYDGQDDDDSQVHWFPMAHQYCSFPLLENDDEDNEDNDN